MSTSTDNIINPGSDQKDFQIDFTDADGSESDLSIYSNIELHIMDEFDNVFAKYKKPFDSLNPGGYYELQLPFTSILQFDIHKEDSQYFTKGDLYANVTFTLTNADFPDGYQPEVTKILLAQVR
jgi:hypothetical protein